MTSTEQFPDRPAFDLVPQFVPLFRMDLHVTEPILTFSNAGTHATVFVEGGRVTGDRVSGEALGGGDWLVMDSAGVARVDVRMALRMDDGPIVHMTYNGRMILPPDGLDRIGEGETLPPEHLYFRNRSDVHHRSRRVRVAHRHPGRRCRDHRPTVGALPSLRDDLNVSA